MQFRSMDDDRDAFTSPQDSEGISMAEYGPLEERSADDHSLIKSPEQIDWTDDPGYSAYTFGFLALAKGAIGSGVLGLPAALKTTGWLVGIFVVLFTWTGSLVGQAILFKCAFRCGGRDTSWFNLARKSFNWLPVLADFAIAFKCIGVSCSYLIIVRSLMPPALNTLFGTPADSWLASKIFWVLSVGVGVVSPLMCLKNLDALKFTSALGLITVLYVSLLIVVYAIFSDSMGSCTGSVCHQGITAGPHSFTDMVSALPTFVFAFQCNTTVFMIFNEAINNRPRFMIWRCTVPTHIVMLIVDGMVAYSGYLLYGAHVKSNVLVGNFPANSIAVALARLGISVTVTASIPLQLFPGRVCVLNLIDAARRYYAKIESPAIVATASDANSANRGPLYWGVTAVCVVLVCLLSYLVNSLGIVYEVVGATAATLMSYILPGLYAIAFFPDSGHLFRLGWAYTLFGVALMTVSLYGSISNAIA